MQYIILDQRGIPITSKPLSPLGLKRFLSKKPYIGNLRIKPHDDHASKGTPARKWLNNHA